MVSADFDPCGLIGSMQARSPGNLARTILLSKSLLGGPCTILLCRQTFADEDFVHCQYIGGFVRSQEMPHPRRATGEVNVPRFSELVGNTSPYLPEPAANTTLPAPPAKRLPFSPRVAAYTLAFVATIVGGIYLGATSRDMMEQWEVRILFFL